MFQLFRTKWFRSAPVVAAVWITLTAGIIVDRAKAFGISSELVDGLDFFKIYDSAAKAIHKSRNDEM